MHLGSGARIQRVLNKALAGQSITISVLGGSGICLFPSSFYTPKLIYPPVSACHGAGDDSISSTCYPSRFFQWWNTVFPHPATELTNGALRRTNSGYFGYCNSHHLPDQTDLVIIELDTEDERTFLVCFFHTTRFFLFPSCFCSLSVWRAHPKYHTFRTALSSPRRRTFPDLARVAAHRPSHLARLLIYPLPWLHSSSLWFYTFHIFH